MDVLKTPSSDVQRAVSDCLAPLMASLASDDAYIDKILKRVLELLLKGATYGDRQVHCCCKSWEHPADVSRSPCKYRIALCN